MDYISRSSSENYSVDSILYTDFKRAFDVVNIELLVRKLYANGFDGKLLSWIESFLTGRTQ